MPAANSGASGVVRRRDRQLADGDARTDSSGVFACRAAAVAFGVNPPEQRPSVSAAAAATATQ
jgi:hypothetical protein